MMGIVVIDITIWIEIISLFLYTFIGCISSVEMLDKTAVI